MISTHVLDTVRGRPAAGLGVKLERFASGAWLGLGEATTDDNGRVGDFPIARPIAGTYRLLFETGRYFTDQRIDTFYPHVSITFDVRNADEHYHVPLLLSPFGYSTYRGS